ncbi:hypothetical protein M440DRAFT_1376284 [Trichoderma longibrachiatum ATCC 18648]|uniref:Uncharacterized protein n=1 Tax=Trichoderma longibrachiatum ATCC 18648 TaxID=983965 RepID=A0A2T4C5Q1_TRILO|nr:hypothetical protein M440DRAFT_1376284 [Trichoderma longibrachiatum ATCC 18648]
MACSVVSCRKVLIAHQTCGERTHGPDNISDVMCKHCYQKTQVEVPEPTLKDKAKYYARKLNPSGGSSSKVRPHTATAVPLLDDQVVQELSEIANKKRRSSQGPAPSR